MSFPRYPKYKDSGVNELGDLPEHWDVKPLKHFAGIDSCGCYGVDADGSDHVLPVATTAQIDSDGRFVVPDMPMRGFTPVEIQRYGCGDGDILVVKSSGSATNIISGKAGLVTKETPPFVFSNFLMRIRPTNGVANPRFIYSLLRSHLTRQRVEQMCSTTTYPNLKVSEYTSAPLPLPPVDEQTKIASFLDRETSKIDGLVGEQRRLIELLKEKRQAVISHAVTKGLNPHAPLKPSGIEWLGDVPEHWTVASLRYFATFCTGSTPDRNNPKLWEGGIPWVKTGEINYATITETEETISQEGLDSSSCSVAPAGTLLMALYGQGVTRGRVAILGIPAAFNQACVAISVDNRITNDYLHAFFVFAYSFIRDIGNETTQMNMNVEFVRRIRVVVPAIREQIEIAEHVKREGSRLDALTAAAERGIELLQERRTALISAAVTGQIDVRRLVTS